MPVLPGEAKSVRWSAAPAADSRANCGADAKENGLGLMDGPQSDSALGVAKGTEGVAIHWRLWANCGVTEEVARDWNPCDCPSVEYRSE